MPGSQASLKLTAGEVNLSSSGWLELLKWALGWRKRYRISGSSMLPALVEGQHVLVNAQKNPRSLAAGDIVVLWHPSRRGFKLLKRIRRRIGQASFFVTGDNPHASMDSRHFGPVPVTDILGQVTSVLGT